MPRKKYNTPEEARLAKNQKAKEWRERNRTYFSDQVNEWNKRQRALRRVQLGLPPSRKPGFTIEENGCWLWTGAFDNKGYGQRMLNRRRMKAHHYMWEITNDRRVPRGYDLHHSCLNPKCVNPEHLELLTHGEHKRHHLNEERKKQRS